MSECATMARPRWHRYCELGRTACLGVIAICIYRNMPHMSSTCTELSKLNINKHSSGDEIANVNFYAVRPEGTRIR